MRLIEKEKMDRFELLDLVKSKRPSLLSSSDQGNAGDKPLTTLALS